MTNITKRCRTMDNKQRPSGAAPPVGSRDFYEKTNPYWLQQAASRKRQAASGAGGPVSGKFLIDKK